jgi:drug/metabolite transporter (DMT)-like permease
MTTIGTISHEFGHFISAKILGFNSKINYGATILEDNANKIMSEKEYFIFTLGGPIQTIFTGSLGLLALYHCRKTFIRVEKLSFRQWFFIFISLFWLRQLANLFTWILGFFIKGKFSERGDEIKLARYLNLPNWTIISSTALIGFLILTIIIFKFIPKKERLIFIFSGLFGGISGYILWLHLLGKILMP